MFWVIIVSFAVLIAVALAIYSMPPDHSKAARRKEKRQESAVQEKPKDKEWQAIAQRWEKHNIALQADIAKMKMEQKGILLTSRRTGTKSLFIGNLKKPAYFSL